MMELKYSFLKVLGRLIGIVLLVQLGVLGLIAFIGWRAGWGSWEEYTNALQMGGIFIVGIGFLGIRGNWEVTRSFGYQYSMSTIDQSSTQRTQRILTDFVQSYNFMLVMFFVGGLSLLLGWVLG